MERTWVSPAISGPLYQLWATASMLPAYVGNTFLTLSKFLSLCATIPERYVTEWMSRTTQVIDLLEFGVKS